MSDWFRTGTSSYGRGEGMVINEPGARRNSSLPGSNEEDTLWGSPEKEWRLDTAGTRTNHPVPWDMHRPPSDRLLLQQLEVGKSESLLQQDGDGSTKDEEAILQLGILPVAEMDRNEPDQRCQEQ